MLMFRPLMRYADFNGRASRAELWLFTALQAAVYAICLTLAFFSVISAFNGGPGGMGRLQFGIMGVMGWMGLIFLIALVFALPNYAVFARRLHDIGRSAWWMLLCLPNFVLQIMRFNLGGPAARFAMTRHSVEQDADLLGQIPTSLAALTAIGLVATVCNLILLGMAVIPGQRGPNRYGADPKDPDAPAPVDRDAAPDDRWDTLIAEARRGDPDQPYKPVFDFGPGPAPEPEPAPFPAQTQPRFPSQQWGNPAWDPGVAPSRPFGRRGS